jgi:hypothetical protein
MRFLATASLPFFPDDGAAGGTGVALSSCPHSRHVQVRVAMRQLSLWQIGRVGAAACSHLLGAAGYSLNRFGLAPSVFCTVDAQGHTVCIAQCLVSVWQFKQYWEAVGRAPTVMFTDRDPAAAAAIRIVFPSVLHYWCIWHLAKSICSNLATKLAGDMQSFMSEFHRMAMVTSVSVCEAAFDDLLEKHLLSAEYMRTWLGGPVNMKRWATCHQVRLTVPLCAANPNPAQPKLN